MAECDFFATEEDHLELVQLFIEEFQAEFFLDGAEVRPSAIRSVSDVMEVIRNNKHDPRFFIVSQQWQIEPLSIEPTACQDGKTRFYVRPRKGGPSIDFLARRLRTTNGGSEIVPSWLSDYPTYYASNAGPDIARPASMASCFDAARRKICHRGMRTTVLEWSKPGPWLRPDARLQFERGAWLRVGDLHHAPRPASTVEPQT